MSSPETVISALGKIARNIGGGIGPDDWFKDVRSGTREEVFVRYAKGRGDVTADGKYVILHFDMFDLDGSPDGHLNTVFEGRHNTQEEILKWVKPPEPIFDKPSKVEDVVIHGFTKATWTFRDNSSIVAVGPTLTTVAVFKDGSSQLFVRMAATITGGTGRFQGALGGLTAIGSTFMEKGKPFGPGADFIGGAIECFRVIKESEIVNTERE